MLAAAGGGVGKRRCWPRRSRGDGCSMMATTTTRWSDRESTRGHSAPHRGTLRAPSTSSVSAGPHGGADQPHGDRPEVGGRNHLILRRKRPQGCRGPGQGAPAPAGGADHQSGVGKAGASPSTKRCRSAFQMNPRAISARLRTSLGAGEEVCEGEQPSRREQPHAGEQNTIIGWRRRGRLPRPRPRCRRSHHSGWGHH